ncbi:MAG: hypothetical protein RLY47_498 [Candidatus Parcubacteria bacterium]|jgi:hypothetical protein
MVTKKFKEMCGGDHTMVKGVLWIAKNRFKEDGKTLELMLVDKDNPTKTWRPSANTEFEVMSVVDEG